MDVLIRLTKKCNQNCLFCNVKHDFKDLTTEEAKKQIAQIAGDGSKLLSISGGEPTLKRDLFTIISFAASLNKFKEITLQTNAVMLSYEKYAEKLKQAGLDRAFIAIHSHKQNVSDNLTRTTGMWPKTVRGIKNALKNRIGVTLNPVVNTLNYKDLPGFVQFVNKNFKGIEGISFSFVQPQGEAWANRWIVPKYSQVEPYLQKALGYCSEKGIRFFNPYCGFPLCYFKNYEKLSNEYEDNFTYGAYTNKSLELVKSSKVKPEKCKSCIYDSRCNGVWKWYAEIYGMDELVPVKKGEETNKDYKSKSFRDIGGIYGKA